MSEYKWSCDWMVQVGKEKRKVEWGMCRMGMCGMHDKGGSIRKTTFEFLHLIASYCTLTPFH